MIQSQPDNLIGQVDFPAAKRLVQDCAKADAEERRINHRWLASPRLTALCEKSRREREGAHERRLKDELELLHKLRRDLNDEITGFGDALYGAAINKLGEILARRSIHWALCECGQLSEHLDASTEPRCPSCAEQRGQ